MSQGYALNASVLIIGVCTDTHVIYQSVLEKKTYEWLICDA